jgi:phosphate transport system permease protein
MLLSTERPVNEMIKKKIRVTDIILRLLIWLFSFITIGALAWILIYIISKGISYINWEFISTIYRPTANKEGIFPFIISTLYLVALTLAISTPIGICSAIYLVEYSKPGKILNIIRFATETLAGIPSIIYGLFGLIFFVEILGFGYSILSGSLTVGIMVLPTIIRTTEEALKSVPITYKEGSLALGATKLKTISKVVLPCAIPGILTAVILSIGRIVGETAAIYFTMGYVTRTPSSLMDSGRTLSVHLFQLAREGLSLQQAFATATILVILVAIINLAANIIAGRIKKMATGSGLD